ncbi:hypothetical protein ILUMI_07861 [Ignelater luminosus]|uniref:Large ribosomal subunit protein mL46 n=1 Tax=Ignelater luminosus TaxID=2038154 RepID=A0A8K0GHL5_IGNLU|nr:hypothetical protein ILUMI_07861 [Ignelater luminosus]
MLTRYLKLIENSSKHILTRGFCSSVTADKWDLITAVCLERKPILTPPLNDLEQNFKSLLSQLEYEHSLKSNHEVRHEHEIKQQELLKKGDTDADIAMKETAQDLLDAWNDELSKFTFGSTITEDDKSNNVKSLNRKLNKHLVLLVKHKLGKETHFLLPQRIRQDGEALRQTAERVLQETCPDVKARFYSNAPSGFYKYKYPKHVQEENKAVGAKVFIYLARHCKGQLSDKGPEFKWLDRIELKKELNPNYHHSVSQFLIDEE